MTAIKMLSRIIHWQDQLWPAAGFWHVQFGFEGGANRTHLAGQDFGWKIISNLFDDDLQNVLSDGRLIRQKTDIAAKTHDS